MRRHGNRSVLVEEKVDFSSRRSNAVIAKLVARRAYDLVKKWVVLPIIGTLLGAMVVGRVAEAILGPKSYKVYLVGSLDDEATRQIKSGFLESGIHRTLDGVKIDLEAVDDLGDAANAQRISAKLAARDNTLLVVGHIASTQTKAALPAYLEKARPPIPVILTTETNPDLLPPKTSSEAYDPVFRLSPTDDAQAERAADFAISQGAQSFWVMEDLSNPVYSEYLARAFIENAQAKHRKVLLLSTNLELPSIETIERLGVDWLFFAGGWRDALIVTRQLKALKLTRIRVFLSDGCMDPRLISEGGADVDGVYLSYPLTVREFGRTQYRVYGRDAAKLADELIESADRDFGSLAGARGGFAYVSRRVLGLRRVGDARAAVIAYMEAAVRTQHRFDLSGGGEPGQFQDDGSRVGASFHVWRIRGGQFEDAE